MKGFKWQWIVKILFFAPLFVLVFVGGTQWLWNHLAVDLINVREITFVETIGLMLLGRLITGGFHKGHSKHSWKGADGTWGPPWKTGRMMREKWYKMTPEEREEFKKKWADCGPSWGEKKAENTPPPVE